MSAGGRPREDTAARAPERKKGPRLPVVRTRACRVEWLVMRRLLVLLTLAVGLGALGVGLVACGGNDKPPLTPDTVEPLPDGTEAGAPTTTPPPAK